MASVDFVATDILQFDHLHVYVDELKPLSEYKALEARFNALEATLAPQGGMAAVTEDTARAAWLAQDGSTSLPEFVVAEQDLVAQMISGAGWRIAAAFDGASTTNYVVHSRDSTGIRFVFTAKTSAAAAPPAAKRTKEEFEHFDGANVDRFVGNQSGRQGIAVLAFEVPLGATERIRAAYAAKHPKLLKDAATKTYAGVGATTVQILEVFAYYTGAVGTSDADRGTLIRFIERTAVDGTALPLGTANALVLPGLAAVEHTFETAACPAFADHWVSNVVSRTGFLATLEDTLGFTPKVDFNAGVVAAGEAIIESTVTGNASPFATAEEAVALVNQSQVYLPINNALSEVGHVYCYLDEIGQGVQHVANRVCDLPSFIEWVNRRRRVTGMGFSFLNIPRSYYGRLKDTAFAALSPPISPPLVAALNAVLKEKGLVDLAGIVKIDIAPADVTGLGSALPEAVRAEFEAQASAVFGVLSVSRYSNLKDLLGDGLDEVTYLKIVRNKILVDIQNSDILYQIFTTNVLQRIKGQEVREREREGERESRGERDEEREEGRRRDSAHQRRCIFTYSRTYAHPTCPPTPSQSPFLEFIQRVCGVKGKGMMRPGCGGFGIRNFLTLFLSIELSKAMVDLTAAADAGNTQMATLAQQRISLFEHQLEESNPILTAISEAMTQEGLALEDLAAAESDADKARLTARVAKYRALKEGGNTLLQGVSERHAAEMMRLRKEVAALSSK